MRGPSFLCLLLGSACAGGAATGSRTGDNGQPPQATASATVSASASAAPSARVPAPAAPSAGVTEAAPITLLAAAADARWIAYCTAERDSNGDGRVEVRVNAAGKLEGDALTARLSIAGNPPRAIDELVTSDARGRYVVVREAERYLLLDSHGDSVLDLSALSADLRTDSSALPGHRALAFDQAGQRLAYLRGGAQGSELVLRNLATGSERVVPTSLGEIHRMEIAAGDGYAVLHAVAEDTNKNGRLDWPLPPARSPRSACQGPLQRIAARYPTGDKAVTVVVPLGTTGKPVLAPDLVTALGPALLRRAPSGELVLAENGRTTSLASAQCAGRVLHADAARQLLLIACTGKSTVKAEVELVAAGFRKPLKVAVQATDLDAEATQGERLIAVYPGAEALLVDFETRDVHALEPGDLVIATWGSRALIRNRQALRLYDATSRAFQKLDVELSRISDVLASGHFVFVSPALVDLARGTIAGKSPLRPLALSSDGKLLVAEGAAGSAERLAQGPLRWIEPTP